MMPLSPQLQQHWQTVPRLATEISKRAAVVMLYRTLKFLPVPQPRRDGVAIGARQQLDAVDVAGQLRQLVSGIFYRSNGLPIFTSRGWRPSCAAPCSIWR